MNNNPEENEIFAKWAEEDKRRRMTVAAKDNLNVDNILEFFDACDIEVHRTLYVMFNRFKDLNNFVSFLDDFEMGRLTEKEQEKFSEFFKFFNERCDEMYHKVKLSEV